MGSNAEEFAKELIERARAINKKLRGAVPATGSLVSSANTAIHLADDQTNLIDILKNLHSGDEKKSSIAIERLEQMHPNEFAAAVDSGKELQRAQYVAHEKLEKLTEEMESTYNKNKNSWKAVVKKTEEAEPEKTSWFKRTFGDGKVSTWLEEHSTKMEQRTKGERLGISTAQVGLGFVGINIGSGMLQQAASGVKRKKVFADDGMGNRQLAAITAVPVGTGERTFKAATGALITAAGIGSFMLGAHNFSKSL